MQLFLSFLKRERIATESWNFYSTFIISKAQIRTLDNEAIIVFVEPPSPGVPSKKLLGHKMACSRKWKWIKFSSADDVIKFSGPVHRLIIFEVIRQKECLGKRGDELKTCRWSLKLSLLARGQVVRAVSCRARGPGFNPSCFQNDFLSLDLSW